MNKPQRRPWWPNATQTLLLPFLLLLLPNHARSLQRIVEEPEDTVARLGETVVLKCRVQDQKGQVTWQKGDLGLGPHRDLPYWDRMSMVGSLGDGDFHLEIRNVSLDDEETYQCQLSAATEEEPAILSRRARLNVIVEPQGPVLLGESIAPLERSQPVATTEGQPIRLSCQSRAGKPPAQLGWAVAEDWQAQRLLAHIDNGTAAAATASRHAAIHPMRVREHSAHRISQRLVGNITELVDFDENSELHTVTSHLTFSPTKEENGRWLVCLASHPSYGRESRTASVELDVFYSPKVRVEVDMASSQLREGGHAKLRCLSDARPSEQLKFSWHWDGETKRLEVLDSKTALIAGLRFNDHGRRVSCTVENSLGPGSGVLELDVPYGPRFMSTNQTKTVDRGSEVNFQCEVLGNPAPTVRWYHGRDWETAVYEGKNFTIRNVQDWEEGQYRCTAHVDGFPPQTLYHMLYLKGPPRVNFGEFFVSDGGSKLTLVCTVQSRALPVRVHWLHNGHRVDIEHSANADRYRVRDEKTSAHELISRLEIAGFNHDDFGLWNCSAKNEFGLVWDQRDIQLLGIMEKLSVELGKLQSWQIVAFFSLLAALILLPVAVFCCIRSCCRSKGHSKLSNHSSDPRGDFSVKCEELDGCLSNGPTPPFHAQPFYPEPLQPAPDYLSEPQYNPDMDRSVLLNNYSGNGQSLSAAGVLMDSASAQQQHFNNYLGGGLPPDPYSGTFDGVVLTNFAGVPTDFYDPSMVNSFGVQRLPFPGQQQQQHFYGYGGPSPLEPVTEVCTPESGEGPQAPGDGMERTLSRISSHV